MSEQEFIGFFFFFFAELYLCDRYAIIGDIQFNDSEERKIYVTTTKTSASRTTMPEMEFIQRIDI